MKMTETLDADQNNVKLDITLGLAVCDGTEMPHPPLFKGRLSVVVTPEPRSSGVALGLPSRAAQSLGA